MKNKLNYIIPLSFLVIVMNLEAQHGHDDHGHGHGGHEDHHSDQTELSQEAFDAANLTIDIAGPRAISRDTRVYGRLIPNEDKIAHISPRFAGVVKQVKKSLGDKVEKGEVLAIVESNQSLQPYEIRSELQGIVIGRHATVGEVVTEGDEIFIVGDLSEVWADFQIYRDDFAEIQPGQKILIDLGDGRAAITAKVNYVSPVTDEATQSKLIRTTLPNIDSSLRPGLFISALLSAEEKEAPVAVTRDAIQLFRGQKVVFINFERAFRAAPVELGRQDSQHVEVLAGLKAGDRYVSKGSFIIKADIEKSEASHDH